jgi:hypothetical protein
MEFSLFAEEKYLEFSPKKTTTSIEDILGKLCPWPATSDVLPFSIVHVFFLLLIPTPSVPN